MEICDFLKNSLKPGQKYAVLGIGSTLRSDDAAGMYFTERLGKMIHREDLLVIAGSTAPENFTGVIKEFRPDKLFIVDAAHLGLQPGEIQVVPDGEIGGVSFSTHMLPLPVMMKYLASEVGCEVIFIGIQPKSTEHGFTMCGEVKNAVKKLADDFYHAFEENE